MSQTREGALKIKAKIAGVSIDEYRKIIASGMKWCTGCKMFHALSLFNKDSSRSDGLSCTCKIVSNVRNKKRYVPKVRLRHGPEINPARDGDKKQARRRINVEVRTGKRLHPGKIACVDCGHTGNDRRHEYDHYLGYSSQHHYDVEAVCTRCHHAREMKRGSHGGMLRSIRAGGKHAGN